MICPLDGSFLSCLLIFSCILDPRRTECAGPPGFYVCIDMSAYICGVSLTAGRGDVLYCSFG